MPSYHSIMLECVKTINKNNTLTTLNYNIMELLHSWQIIMIHQKSFMAQKSVFLTTMFNRQYCLHSLILVVKLKSSWNVPFSQLLCILLKFYLFPTLELEPNIFTFISSLVFKKWPLLILRTITECFLLKLDIFWIFCCVLLQYCLELKYFHS